ncbi:MarR family winged helix-turn-helix transcriptional regulator [Blautia sp. An46]|uniref:MarR family winged helix-turn-helix transcriptional regulator n=1 Tax=Blautia sp. An46 TaxID=1965636 RepID=UPI000B39B840|nr:MarR family transcriptional regulator [Blautia sp. An46]OUN93692.1 MarR family transcriptional regulator [Blautia sp. An46]HJD37199.1 MarR family transcriptional regulator [Candidatus Blautia ornithocaccae]
MSNYEVLHDILVKLFQEILDIESKALITSEFKDISVNDMHIIEAIGEREPKNMSSVAKIMSVTVGTLTIAINSLVKKGYVHRERSEEDRRVVLISLTEKGKKANAHHMKFHDGMIQAVLKDLNEEQQEVLVKALMNLRTFFDSYR